MAQNADCGFRKFFVFFDQSLVPMSYMLRIAVLLPQGSCLNQDSQDRRMSMISFLEFAVLLPVTSGGDTHSTRVGLAFTSVFHRFHRRLLTFKPIRVYFLNNGILFSSFTHARLSKKIKQDASYGG